MKGWFGLGLFEGEKDFEFFFSFVGRELELAPSISYI